MANGRNKVRKGDAGRDAGGFIALPWSVLDCPAYAKLGHPARSLLMEVARQILRDNNGRLLASAAYLAKRGWNSRDVITRAKRELLDAGFIFETVMGQRPNKASWYAVTWRALDKLPGFDAGAAELFERGAYQKNATLRPSGGHRAGDIGPSHGLERQAVGPLDGPMRPTFATSSRPSYGHHLENHLQVAKSQVH